MEAVKQLQTHLQPLIPKKYCFPHEKASDDLLCALEVLRLLNKHPYRKSWFDFVRLNFFTVLPSYTQIYLRLERLGTAIEAYVQRPVKQEMVIIDSMPLPVCRSKRSLSAKVRFAALGFSTQGKVYGFKCHVWLSEEGQFVQHVVLPANEHDFTGALRLNAKWADFGCPKIIGDKAYVSPGIITPPKKNATGVDVRWKPEYGKLRVSIERAFSWVVRVGLRSSQVKTLRTLKTRLAFAFLAHNLKFAHP